MSLDQNLFTLHLTQNKDNPHVVDLVDPSGTVHYRKQRIPGTEYKVEVYDPISESLLVTATSPLATSKAKVLELCNPTMLVDLKYTGTLSFRWAFKWEDNEFEWKREECFMLRKPDPPVLVAVTKEPAGRLKTSTVQILDYNLNRFDIDDRKGLEIVILTALLTFQDANEAHRTPQEKSSGSGMPAVARRASASVAALASGSASADTTPPPPLPPPKPAPKTGVDRIAEMQAARGEYNEITVEEEGHVDHYAQYCAGLLEDDAMLFVTVKSAAAEQVPKVLQVVEQTKRIRHKAGLSEDSELHQYVLYDTEKQKGPRRINLDDKDKAKKASAYSPPTSLTIHLSKIDMPELQPKASGGDRHAKDDSGSGSSSIFSRHKTDKESRKKEDKKASSTSTKPPTPPQNTRPPVKPNQGRSSSSSPKPHGRIPHQTHTQSSTPPAPASTSKYSNSNSNSHPTVNTYTAPPSSRPHAPPIHAPPAQHPAFPTPHIPGQSSGGGGTLNAGWNRPARHSFHAGTGTANAFYGPGTYAPPPPKQQQHPYAASHAQPPATHAHVPPPPAPVAAAPAPHKPNTLGGLISSFLR